jgi:hypothetical protein
VDLKVSVDNFKKAIQDVIDGTKTNSMTNAAAIKKLEEEKLKGDTILGDIQKKVF